MAKTINAATIEQLIRLLQALPADSDVYAGEHGLVVYRKGVSGMDLIVLRVTPDPVENWDYPNIDRDDEVSDVLRPGSGGDQENGNLSLGESVDKIEAAKKILEEKSDQHGAKVCTISGNLPDPKYTAVGSAPQDINPSTGQHKDYYVLCEEERRKGFVRPVRSKYIHKKCGTVTTMGIALSETYARDPKFYGATFCCCCGNHFPLVIDGEYQFLWDDGSGDGVGS